MRARLPGVVGAGPTGDQIALVLDQRLIKGDRLGRIFRGVAVDQLARLGDGLIVGENPLGVGGFMVVGQSEPLQPFAAVAVAGSDRLSCRPLSFCGILATAPAPGVASAVSSESGSLRRDEAVSKDERSLRGMGDFPTVSGECQKQ